MSADQVTGAFDLRATLFNKTFFNRGPGQMRRDPIPVHRFGGPEAEVFYSEPPWSVEVDHLARPSTAVSLQDGFRLAVHSRTGKVRRVLLTLAPLRNQNPELYWELGNLSVERTDEVTRLPLRSAHAHFRVAPVL